MKHIIDKVILLCLTLLLAQTALTFTVTAEANEAPRLRISDTQVAVNVGRETTFNVSVKDKDFDMNDKVTIRVVPSSAAISVSPQSISDIVDTMSVTFTLKGNTIGGGSETITVTATDNAGAMDSETLPVRIGEVDSNAAPIVEIITSSNPAIGSTTSIVVSIRDEDFDLGDSVTLTASSSDPLVVSVTPESLSGIKSNGNRSFTLSRHASGEVTITITATDNLEDSHSETVEVRPNTPPVLTIPNRQVSVKAGREATFNAMVSDADIDDTLTLQVAAADPDQKIVELVTTETVTVSPTGVAMRAEQTFRIKGSEAGTATLNIVAEDATTAVSQPVSVVVTVDPNTTPTVTIAPDLTALSLLEGESKTLKVTATDADADDDIADLIVNVTSDNPELATATLGAIDDTGYPLVITAKEAGTVSITVTVDDGRGTSNSIATEKFTVEVEANEAPTVQIVTSPSLTIDFGTSTSIVISIQDANFAQGDSVTLTVSSSDPSVVSVTPESIDDDIRGDATYSFVLTGDKAGTSMISFTATDNNEAQGTVSVSLSVSPVVFTGRKWSEFYRGAKFVCANDDIDRDEDNDGLIELCYLEDVAAINDNLSGGYELVRDLDFEDDGSYSSTANKVTWTTGAGWTPIGRGSWFQGTLEGNGHTISNLFMNKGGNLGFIEHTFGTVRIRNLGLSRINIISKNGASAGPLLAQANSGAIVTNCYVQGKLRYEATFSMNAAGFIGGRNSAVISSSYTDVSVSGNILRGFFFTNQVGGSVSNSYAIGDLSQLVPDRNTRPNIRQGFGFETFNNITNIYYAVSSRGNSNGALISTNRATLKNSYWDSTKWKGAQKAVNSNVGGTLTNVQGFTTIKLQQATASTDTTQPYYEWSTDNWDFRTDTEYPALKYATECGSSQQPDCGTLLRGQKTNLPPVISGQNNTQIPNIRLLEEASTTLNVVITDADGDPLSVKVESSNSAAAEATITASGANRVLTITAAQAGTARITVTADDGLGKTNSETEATFTVTVEANQAPTLTISDMQVTVKTGEDRTFNVTVSDENFDANDNVNLTVMSSPPAVLSVTPPSISDIIDATPATFTLTGQAAGDATITITATDSGELSNSKTLSVQVKDNAPPTLVITPDPSDLRLLEGMSKTFVVKAADTDDDFADLTVDVMSDDSATATATLGAVDDTDYPLVIRAIKAGIVPITVSVDDGGARVTKTFEVTVVENQAPTLEISGELSRTVEAGDMTTISMRVRDANFDLGDSVTLTALPSTPSVVSVIPGSFSDLVISGSVTFSLTGEQVGESNISFTATDINGGRNTVSVRLSVFSSLATGTVPEKPEIATIGKAFSLDTSDFFTYSGAELLSYTTATVLPNGLSIDAATGVISGTLPNNTDASTDMNGLSVTVTTDDGRGGSASATFTLLINAEPSGTVTIGFNANTWQLTATSGVSDANGIDATMTSYQWFKGETVVSTTDSNTYTILNDNSGRAAGTEYKVDVTFVDNIGQSATTSSNVYTVANQAPVIMSVMPAKPNYDEGERVEVTTNASDANHDGLTYTWGVTSRDRDPSILEDATETDDGQISFDVPADWVVKASTATDVTETLQLQVTVSDGDLSTTQTATVVVTKIDNGTVDQPSISVDRDDVNLFTFEEIALADDPDGENDNPNLNYRWQRCLADADCSTESNWQDVGMPITDATNRSLTVPSDLRVEGNKFRVQILYTDGQGYRRDDFFSSENEYTDSPPTITPIPDIILLEGTSKTLVVTVTDVDGDPLDVSLDSTDGMVARVTIVATSDADRTLKITALDEGTAAITVTADDGRGEENSTAVVTFMVTVEANEAPTLSITPTDQRLQINDTAEITATVSDENFDANDSVTLTAMSSTPSVVSVAHPNIGSIVDATPATFTLTAHAGGDAMITITATDSQGESVSETVSVHVNAPPTIASHDSEVTLKESRVQSINVTVSDVDTEDILTLSLTATDPQDVVELVTTNVTVATNNAATRDVQTFRIKGLKAGTATLNIVVADDDMASAMASVEVTVEPNAMPTITIAPDPLVLRLLEGTSKTLVVTAADADPDDIANLIVGVMSGDTTTATATLGAVDGSDYPLVIKAIKVGTVPITITADDGRGVANSRATKTFEVTVEANEAPKLSITPTDQRLQINDTAEITATVSDENFDANDSVTLTAMSSTPSAVSVAPPNIGSIVDATPATFTLTAHAGGDAIITITATDSQGASVSKTVSVHVNAPPVLTILDEQIGIKAGRETSFNVTVSDVDTEDTLTLRLTVADPGLGIVELVTTTVMVVTNDMATRPAQTFRIKGLKAGTATLNIAVADDDMASAMASVEVTVEPNAMPEITITPDPSVLRLLEGTSKTLVVTAADADTDDDAANFIVNVMSDNPTTATATLGANDGTGYPLVITAIKAGTVPITITADDGRGVANSRATKTFEVTVEANEAPMLVVEVEPSETVEIDADTSIGISIRDANFDAGDSVTLEAVSSPSSVVFVRDPIIGGIDNSDTQFFSFFGDRVGESEITIIATDRNGESNTVSRVLTVYSSLATGTVPTDPVIATIGKELDPPVDTSTFFTYGGSDPLSYTATGLPDGLSIDAGTGVISGTLQTADPSMDTDGLSVTVTADGGRDGSVPAMFRLLINAETGGMVSIGFDSNTWQLTADTSGVSDANGIDETMTSYQWFKGEMVVSTTDSNTYTIPDDNDGRAGGTEYKVDVRFVDNIGQSTTLSAVYTVANQAPVIDAINPVTQTVNEDETVSITASASDANNDDLTYTWSVASRDGNPSILTGATKTNGQIGFDVPADWVVKASAATDVTETLQLQVTVSDGDLSTTQTATVVVTKVDNDKVDIPSIDVDRDDVNLFTFQQIDLTQDADGVNDNPNLNYRWQRCLADADCSTESNWQDVGMPITDAADRSLTVPSDLRVEGNKFRVQILYTDGQGYRDDDFFSSEREYTASSVNSPPTITPIPDIILLEETSKTSVVTVTDVDGDPLSVSLDSTDSTVATATIVATSDADRTLKIAALDEGTAAITVTADDGRGEENSTAVVTFMVTVEVNEAPMISITEPNQRLQVNETAAIIVTVSDENFDANDSVTLTAMSSTPSVVSVAPPNIGIVDATPTTFTLTAHAGGDTTITITATDSQGASVSETVSVHVNAPPTIASYDSEVTVKAGRFQSINVTVSDVDTEDTLTLRLTEADPGLGIVELVTATVMVVTNDMATRPAQTFRIKGLKAGTATLNIAVADDDMASAMASVEVTVEPNAMPEITITPDPSVLRLLEGTSKTLVVTAADADTDDDAANFIVNVMSDNPTTATATLGANDGTGYPLVITAIKAGTVPITITADDGRGVANSRATKTFEVTVEANEAPMLVVEVEPSETVEIDADTSIEISIRDANFDAGDSVTLTAMSSTPSVVSVTPASISDIGSDTNQTFTLTGEGVGESEISFTATDINGERSTVSVLLSVFLSLTLTDNVPTDPVIATVGKVFNLDASTFFTYGDNDTLSYTATGLPDGLSIDAGTGVISGTLQSADPSMDTDGLSVTVTASGKGGSAEAMFRLLINAETGGMVSIVFDSNTWQLTADTSGVSDANGIDATMTSYQWFKGEMVVSTTDSNTYTIPDDNDGRAGGTEYKVDVRFVDNIGQSTTLSAVYTVANQAPVIDAINPVTQTVNEDETVSITASASDANHDDLTYTWSVTSRDGDPSILTGATKDNGQIGFDVPADWIDKPSAATDVTETLQLEVTVSDGDLSTTQTATVVVTKVDNDKVDIPSIDVDRDDVNLFTFQQIDLTQDADGVNDNPNLNYRWQRCLANADCSTGSNWQDIGLPITDAADRSLTVPSDLRVEGNKFRVQILYTDGQGYRDDDFFSGEREYTANPPDSPPTITPIPDIILLEGTSKTLVVTIADVDGDPLSVSLDSTDSTVAAATIVATSDADRTLKITALDEGTAAITVTADDGRGEENSTAVVTFMVTVEANEAPTLSITPTDQRLQVNDTAEITTTVSDENFDANDSVTLTAMSSKPSVVSVAPPNIDGIVDATPATFTLTAQAAGDTMITITATDSQGASVSETVSVHVNAPPALTILDEQIGIKAGRETSFNVTVSDVDTEDTLTLRLTVADPGLEIVELVTTTVMVVTNNMATRPAQTFRIKGLKEGTAALNIVVADDDMASAMASVEVTVEPNAMPTITIAPDPSALMLLEGTSKTLVVTAADDDTDDDAANFIVDVMSDDTMTATATLGANDGTGYPLVITAIKAGTVPITVTVDDDRGTPNSIGTETFMVTVEANEAPMLEVLSKPSQPIESGTTTDVVIYLSDANFDAGDSVTLEAVSSTPSVVSVTPASISDIGSDTNQTFTLTGEGIGESEISFTATDINGERSTVSVRLSVFSSLTLTDPVIAAVGAAFSLDTSTFFTYGADDTLSYTATGLPDGLSIDAGTGVISGTLQTADPSMDTDGLSVTVTASGKGGSAEAMFRLLINAETGGMVSIAFDSNTWQLTADTSGVSDANGIDETMTSYQWFKGEMVVSTTDSNTYTIPDDNDGRAGGTEYKVDVRFVDNIGQSTTLSAVYTVANQAPVIDAINPVTQTVNEDETVSITASASDANHDDLTYTWSVTSRDGDPSILTGATKDNGQIGFDVPADWVVKASTATDVTETLQLQVTVSDGDLSTTQTATVVVTKIDNGTVDQPLISVDRDDVNLFTFEEIALADDPDGENDNPNLNYRWQRCLADADCSTESNWQDVGMPITDATNRSLTVPSDLRAEGNKFRVQILYTDGQGYRDDDFFSGEREYTASSAVRVRAKVFLEGPLQ